MTFLYGFSGAHRTGKSTLCREIYENYGDVGFIQTTTSQVFKDMGLRPDQVLPPKVRLTVQRKILDTLADQWVNCPYDIAVTDRTPVCLVAYTISDFRSHILKDDGGVSNALLGELLTYIRDCMDVAAVLFDVIFIVRPGIPIVKEEGKALCTEEKINEIDELVMMVKEQYSDYVEIRSLPKSVIDLETRASLCEAVMKATVPAV